MCILTHIHPPMPHNFNPFLIFAQNSVRLFPAKPVVLLLPAQSYVMAFKWYIPLASLVKLSETKVGKLATFATLLQICPESTDMLSTPPQLPARNRFLP